MVITNRKLTRPANLRALALRSSEEVDCIRATGMVLALALDAAKSMCEVGVRTIELAQCAEDVIRAHGAEPLFKGYTQRNAANGTSGFPASICCSINDEVVHGIPGDRQLADGDLVSLDCGVRLNGWCADSATSFLIGDDVNTEYEQLLIANRDCLALAIEMMRPGVAWSTIATAMETLAVDRGCEVVPKYVGHGIGRALHEAPSVPAYLTDGLRGDGDFSLQTGMVLAIEPLLAWPTGGRSKFAQTTIDNDGWTVRTKSGGFASHFEHTIAVTRSGCEVLTAALQEVPHG